MGNICYTSRKLFIRSSLAKDSHKTPLEEKYQVGDESKLNDVYDWLNNVFQISGIITSENLSMLYNLYLSRKRNEGETLDAECLKLFFKYSRELSRLESAIKFSKTICKSILSGDENREPKRVKSFVFENPTGVVSKEIFENRNDNARRVFGNPRDSARRSSVNEGVEFLSLTDKLRFSAQLSTPENTPTSVPSLSNSQITEIHPTLMFDYYVFLFEVRKGLNFRYIIDYVLEKDKTSLFDILLNCIIGGNEVTFDLYYREADLTKHQIELLKVSALYNGNINMFANEKFSQDVEVTVSYLFLETQRATLEQFLEIPERDVSSPMFLETSEYRNQNKSTKSYLERHLLADSYTETAISQSCPSGFLDLNILVMLYFSGHKTSFEKLLEYKLLNILFCISSSDLCEHVYKLLLKEKESQCMTLLNKKLRFYDLFSTKQKVDCILYFLKFSLQENVDKFLSEINPDLNLICNCMLTFSEDINIKLYIGIFEFYKRSEKILHFKFILYKKLNIDINFNLGGVSKARSLTSFRNGQVSSRKPDLLEFFDVNKKYNNIDVLKLILVNV
jgi:hypothetical protein